MQAQCGLIVAALAAVTMAAAVFGEESAGSEEKGLPSVTAIEEMLAEVDALIAKQDMQIAAMHDKIIATEDNMERLRLEEIVFKWNGALDALEEQRKLLADLLSTSRALQDEMSRTEEVKP